MARHDLVRRYVGHVLNTIRVYTIYRYKGLESAIVILTEIDQEHKEVKDQLVYAGLRVVVIGDLPVPMSGS